MKISFLKMKMYWSGVFLGTSTVSSIRICPLEDMVSLSMTLYPSYLQASRDCRHIKVLMFNRAFLLEPLLATVSSIAYDPCRFSLTPYFHVSVLSAG